jgi:hypothetical protein
MQAAIMVACGLDMSNNEMQQNIMTPNENKISHGWRERAWPAMNMFS